MKDHTLSRTLVLIAFLVCVLLVLALPVRAEPPHPSMTNASYHRTQAVQHRQEAARLQGAIQRYQILVAVYSVGSDNATGTMNPQGRRAMVERTTRTLVYFAQQKVHNKQRAAEHETLAQMLPE